MQALSSFSHPPSPPNGRRFADSSDLQDVQVSAAAYHEGNDLRVVIPEDQTEDGGEAEVEALIKAPVPTCSRVANGKVGPDPVRRLHSLVRHRPASIPPGGHAASGKTSFAPARMTTDGFRSSRARLRSHSLRANRLILDRRATMFACLASRAPQPAGNGVRRRTGNAWTGRSRSAALRAALGATAPTSTTRCNGLTSVRRRPRRRRRPCRERRPWPRGLGSAGLRWAHERSFAKPRRANDEPGFPGLVG